MFIPPFQCPKCGRSGHPGETGFQDNGVQIHCECGEVINNDSRDQRILSTNVFARFSTASNQFEYGQCDIVPGQIAKVSFQKHFDFVALVFLTPFGRVVYLKESYENNEGMVVLSSLGDGDSRDPTPIQVNWLVYGLNEIDNLPNWYLLFYGAMTQLAKGLFKPALLDYAVAFEVFLEGFLADRLTKKYDSEVADYLLRRTWRIEDRVKDLLELIIGRRLSERDDVYQPWDQNVRIPRNRLSHGEKMSIDLASAERGHSAVFQAIRWIESVSV